MLAAVSHGKVDRMGGFFVCPRQPGEPVADVEAKYRRSIEVFAHKGLALGCRLERERYVVYRFNKQVDPHIQLMELEDGGFALATGTLFYHGVTGTPALQQLYRDHQAGLAALDGGLQGNYCLLIGTGDGLSLLSDYSGYYPVYANADASIVSSSLMAVGRATGSAAPDPQGFYEFVLNGLVSGCETVLAGVRRLDSRRAWRLLPRSGSVVRQPAFEPIPPKASQDEVAEAAAAVLTDQFKVLHDNFPCAIGAALSGGYDSRLMLALLRHVGATPYLYVYGSDSDDDVRVARAIAAAEGLAVQHIDKGCLPRIAVADYAAQVRHDLFLFDGIKPLGTLDDGSDLATRRQRARKAALQLNGAGGEIYREIWNLGDRRVGLDRFLRMRFDRGDYDFCRAPFDSDAYFDRFGAKVRGLLGIDRPWLERREAEMLFPFLRNLFAAPNNAANNQISPSVVPFMEPALIYPSFDVPIRYKYCGELQARIIARLDPSLARHDSAYGINFVDPVPLGYRTRRTLERHIPLWLRLAKRRLARNTARIPPYYLGAEYLASVLDLERLRIGEWLDVRRIGDPEVLNRALSVELLLNNL